MLRAKKLNSPQGTSQSPDLILKEQDFKLLKTKVKPKRLTNYWTWLQYLGENLNGLNTMMVISKVILPWVFVSSLFLNLLEKTRSFVERDYTGVWYIRIICHNLHQIFGNASRIVFKLIWEHGKRPLEASGQKMQIQLTQQETNILKIHHFLLLILTRVARGLAPIPAYHQARGRVPLGQVTHRDRQPSALTFPPMGIYISKPKPPT